MVNFSLHARHAVVCGSTQGIGRACAIAFARAGASVTLVARDEESLASICEELDRSRDQQHHLIAVDFNDWRALRDRAETHAAEHGPVQILLNNTGGPPAGSAHEAHPEEFARAFAQHLQCNQVLVQAFLDGMRKSRYGRIINIISTSVIMPITGLGVSNTIRGAVANWARTLAGELGPDGITVNNILPGYTDTTRLRSLITRKAQKAGTSTAEVEQQMKSGIPVRRFADPEELAAVAHFLASPAASYISGVNLPVDGGRTAVQ